VKAVTALDAVSEFDSIEEALFRYPACKNTERIHRDHVKHALILVGGFHKDFRYRFLADRLNEADVSYQTRHAKGRAELKGNNKHWEYCHRTPSHTAGYEYNFPVRKVTLIIGTEHTHLPSDNLLPLVLTPTPIQLSKMTDRAKRDAARKTALKIEEKLYPMEERTLAAYLGWLSMILTLYPGPCHFLLWQVPFAPVPYWSQTITCRSRGPPLEPGFHSRRRQLDPIYWPQSSL
jgi:hypothetical protein